MKQSNEELKKYPHIINGIEYKSPLNTHVCCEFSDIKNIDTNQLPRNIWVSTVNLESIHKVEDPDSLPNLMIMNDGPIAKILVVGSYFEDYSQPDNTNSVKAQLILALNSRSSCLYEFFLPDSETYRALVYSVGFKHGKVEDLFNEIIEMDYFLDDLTLLFTKFPQKFSTLGIKLCPKKKIRNTISDLIIPAQDYHYWVLKDGKVSDSICPNENRV